MNINLISYVLTFGAGVILTHTTVSNYYESKIDKFKIDAYKQSVEKVETVLNKERDYNAFLHNREYELSYEIKSIDVAYNSALYSSNIMYNNNSNTTATMSTTSTTTSNNSEGRCECSEKNAEKFRRLYERQLTIARDCDITASHYNMLIDLYQKVVYRP